MIRRFCIAPLQMLLLSLLTMAGYALPADSLKGSLKASLSVSADRLMQQVFSPHGSSLVEYNGFDDTDDLQQQYVNGAVPLYDNTVKEKLLASVKSFNTTNSSKKTKLFAFTGRYFLGYTDFMRGGATSAYDQKIMDALTKGLQAQKTSNGSTEVFRKEFLRVLDDRYQEFVKRSASQQMEKTIVFFYVEAVLGMDHFRESNLKTTYKKRQYCFIWTKGLDVFETQKLNKAFPEFRKLLTLTTDGIANPSGLVACTDKINTLYKSVTDYENPKDAINLVFNLSAEQLEALTVPERMRLLRAMDKGGLTDVNNIFTIGTETFGGEQAAIKVITTVGDESGKEWMDSLQKNNKLVVSLLDKLNDSGMGSANYTKATFSLIGHFYKQVPIEQNKEKFKDNYRTFAFNGFGMWDGTSYSVIKYPESGTIGGMIHIGSGMVYKEYAHGPFDQIAILSSVELPGFKYEKKVDNKHYLVVVPALYLSWVHQVKQNANSWQLGGLAVLIPFNAITFGGGMTLLGSASGIVRTLGYLDIIASTGSTVLNVTPIKDRVKEKYGENSTQYKMVHRVDMAFNIYMVSRLFVDLAGIPQYLDEAAVIWKHERAAMQQQGAVTQKEAQALDNLLSSAISAESVVANGMKEGWTIERVLSFPKGSRPPPSEYLTSEYIAAHLKDFEGGVSFICPKNIIDQYGNLLGRADGVYVISTRKMEELMAKTQGDVAKLEIELAIPTGAWQKQVMCRVDVPAPKDLKLRMPTGNEEGANEFFKPGGFTANGVPEAVIDQIPKAKYTFKPINPEAAAIQDAAAATKGAQAATNAVTTPLTAEQIVQNGMKEGWTIDKFLAFPKASRPPPSGYLKPEYITAHLKDFEGGVSFFCPQHIIETYGTMLGRADGVYVISTRKMEELMAKTQGDMAKIEIELAIPTGSWQKQVMCRVDVKAPKELNLRMPRGDEEGANEFFKPGGFTANGVPEAVIDRIPKGKYTYKAVNPEAAALKQEGAAVQTGTQTGVQTGAQAAANAAKTPLTPAQIVQAGMKDGWTIERVLTYPKGKRPPTKDYLKSEYEATHLTDFEGGVSFFCPQKIIDNYGAKLGRADGVYVISTRKMNELMTKTGGDMAKIEIELAIPYGSWQKQVMSRVDVPAPKELNLRMPTGNEEGANEFFKPGGFTANGVPEAVIDPILKGKYTFKAVNPEAEFLNLEGAAVPKIGQTAGNIVTTLGPEQIVQNGMKEGWTVQKVLSKPQGQREPATVYMTESYITNHLKQFESGAAFICSRQIKDNGNLLGNTDGVYVTTAKSMEELLAKTQGDISRIETELAIPAGTWSKQDMCVVYVAKPKDLGLRMPSGNEKGANASFTPGGYSAKGLVEAVMNPVPKGQYTYKPINYKE